MLELLAPILPTLTYKLYNDLYAKDIHFEKFPEARQKYDIKFSTVELEDLNISEALAALFDFIRDTNKLIDSGAISKQEAEQTIEFLKRIDNVLGVMNFEKEQLEPELAELIEQREKARKSNDFEKADQIRKELEGKGIIVEDTGKGPRWKKVK